MVFYRKYRPQSLDELLGQDHIKQSLMSAFQKGSLAHAYLFCGPRGLGKTSTARILAKMVNCTGNDTSGTSGTFPSIPCNTCASCLSITDGSSLDLIEIDAASNRGIDDIRELRDRIKLSPSSSKKKVYIIDEVHMLTTEAFSALLKTLEEPPAHALFILATTEVQKIPQTILSRVQKMDFKLATPDELAEALNKVIVAEKIIIDPEAIKLIAQKAEGAFRDALKLLDQLSSSSDKITVELVNQSLKSGSMEDQLSLLNFVLTKDPKQALKFLSKLGDEGLNVKEYLASLLNTLRTIILIKNEVLKEPSELIDIAKNFSQPKLINLINHLIKAQENLKYASIPQMVLEIAILESIVPEQYDVIAKQEAEGLIAKQDTPLSVISQKDNSVVISQKDNSVVISNASEKSVDSNESSPSAPIQEIDTSDTSGIFLIKDKWTYILETVKPYNYSLEALLKQAKVISCDASGVILEVPYTFHQRILEAPKSRTVLESILADVLGKEVRVSTILGQRPTRVEELANVELAQDDEIIQIAAEIFNS